MRTTTYARSLDYAPTLQRLPSPLEDGICQSNPQLWDDDSPNPAAAREGCRECPALIACTKYAAQQRRAGIPLNGTVAGYWYVDSGTERTRHQRGIVRTKPYITKPEGN